MDSGTMTIAGRALSGLFAVFMLGASAAPKLAGMPIADDTVRQLGWPGGHVPMIGPIELACVLLYVLPKTSVSVRCP